MNILLIILEVVAGLIGLLLVIALFTKKSYSIARETVISKPVTEVFNYVKCLKNQDHFNKWVMTDPDMKRDFKGTDGTVGFVYAWNGNKKAGEGEQEITNVVEGKRMDSQVRFVRPFKGVSETYYETDSQSPNQTKVSWGVSGKMNYPMNIMLLIMNMEKMMGKDMETSFGNLKEILEKK
jgi:uncharacterized protein YndB with AHSA1/START domain